MWLPRTSRTPSVDPCNRADNILDPGTASIHQNLTGVCRGAVRPFGLDMPLIASTLGPHDACAGHDAGAAVGCIAGTQRHKFGILDPAVRILISLREALFQRQTSRVNRQIKCAGGWQDLSTAQCIIQEKPQTDQPSRTSPFIQGIIADINRPVGVSPSNRMAR